MTEEQALESSPLYLSASSLSTFKQCPMKWKFQYVDRRRGKSSMSMVMGTFAHAVLEEMFNWDPKYRTIEFAKEIARYEWDRMCAKDREFRSLRLTPALKKEFRIRAWAFIEGLWELENPLNIDVVENERGFSIEFEGAIFRGYIDRVSRGERGLIIDDYKGFPLDTVLPTPDGWTTMADVAVGDWLIGSDGKPCQVTGKSQEHHKPCFRITFDDASTLVADAEHLWPVTSTYSGRTELMETQALVGNALFNPVNGQRHLSISNHAPLDLKTRKLRLSPYVLGLWLGDGSSKTGEITTNDPEIITLIENEGWRVGPNTNPSKAGTCGTYTVYHLRGVLAELNLLGNKHVPSAYLRSNSDQRLSLLQGLMDSDGGWNTPRKQCQFNSTNQSLARAVQELAVSLGWKTSTWEGWATCANNGVKSWAYYVRFTPYDMNPFRLQRKANLVAVPSRRSRRRLITSVEPVDMVPTQCVAVNSADNTYLAGPEMVTTHNSGKPPAARYRADKMAQVHLYALMATALYDEPVESVGLLYLGKEVLRVDVDRKLIQKTATKLAKAVDVIGQTRESGEYKPKTGPLCGWCDFILECEAGQAQIHESIRFNRQRMDAPAVAALGLVPG